MQVGRKRKHAAAFGTATRVARRLARGRVRIKVKFRRAKKGVEAPALTYQNDNRTEYRRRPAPRRVKSRARKFVQRVQRVIAKDLPVQTYRYDNFYPVQANVGFQSYFVCPMYSGQSGIPILPTSGTTPPQPGPPVAAPSAPTNPGYDFNHLRQIFNAMFYNGGVLPPALGTAYSASGAAFSNTLLFNNAVLSMSVTNTTAPLTTNSGVMKLDVYHIWARKDSVDNPFDLIHESSILQDGYGTSPPISNFFGTDTTIDFTPFQASKFCRKFIIKSKKTYNISPGQSVDLQLRDRREYAINEDELSLYADAQVTGGPFYRDALVIGNQSLGKYTEAFLCFIRGAPGSTGAAQTVTASVGYNCMYQFRAVEAPSYTFSPFLGPTGNYLVNQAPA